MFYHGFRSRCIALFAAIAFVCMPIGMAHADSPVTITSTVTDPHSFLSDSQAKSASQSLSALKSGGLDAYVVLVTDFSDQAPVKWCEAAGTKSGLSNSSLVLVIATEQRVAATCGNTDQKGIADSAVVSAFAAAKTELGKANPLDADTVVSAIQAYSSSLKASQSSGSKTTTPTKTRAAKSSSTSTSGDSTFLFGSIMLFFFFTVLILLPIILITAIVRSQRKTRKTVVGTQEQQRVQSTLDIARMLLDADDVVRASEDEIEFARAQFGPDAVASFSSAIDNARALVSRGFALQRGNEDGSNPVSTQEMNDFINRLNAAMNQLVQERQSFTERRNKEANIGEQVSDLLDSIAQTRNQISQAEMDLQTLKLAYSAEAIASLIGRPDQARALLDQAETSAKEALAAQQSGQNAYETLEVARRALALARHQLESIAQAPDQLAHSSELLTAAIGSITSDISDVTRLKADPVAFKPLVDSAQAAISGGHAAQNGQGDPLAALESLRLAEASLDEALAPLRSAEERAQRAQSGIDALLSQADSEVARANQHITSHGSLVGFDARSQLSFARSALQNAHSFHNQGNDESAATQARTAITYAQAAITAPLTTPQQSSGSRIADGLTGALVWSVLDSILSSGGSHRRSWGSDWGGSSWGGGGSSNSGSFGGFGGSSGGFGGSSGSGHTDSF